MASSTTSGQRALPRQRSASTAIRMARGPLGLIALTVSLGLLSVGGAQAQSRTQSPVALRPTTSLPSGTLAVPTRIILAEERDSRDGVLPTVAELYRMHALVLDAEARGDEIVAESRLADVMSELQALVEVPEYVVDERFAELYQTVLTEFERYYGPADSTAAVWAEIFQVRAQTFAALNELEDPTEETGASTLPTPMVAPTEVPMTINRSVTTAMQVLLEKRPETLANWAARAHTWFPLIEKVFAEEGVPDELKYLAMIESGLRPAVRSRASAVGMWQFIAATGSSYDLVIDGWVDERQDPEKATRAAARHLKDLFAIHGDWHVALSGYNCSPRCINRARSRAKARGIENPDFWDMYEFLPRETRNYIPQFIATSIMLSNPDAYGIERKEPGAPFAYELVPVRGSLALRDIAEMAGTSEAALNELNPALRRGYLPPAASPYPLRLPTGTSETFLEAYAKLPAEALRPPGEHIVRRGETLSGIASTYGVTLSRLRSDNKIRGSLIHPGQRLIVPVSDYSLPIEQAVAEAEPVSVNYGTTEPRPIHSLARLAFNEAPDENDQSRSDLRAAIVTTESSPTVAVQPPPAEPTRPDGTRISYTVRKGDSLSKIADSHGVTLSDVRAWNGLSGSRIIAGKKLTLFVSDPAAVATSEPTSYKVRRGDTLSEIARAHNVRVQDLRSWNGISGSRISVGQTLKINGGSVAKYQVRRGDTLIDIARTYNVSVSDLRKWNRLNSDTIYPGRELLVAEQD